MNQTQGNIVPIKFEQNVMFPTKKKNTKIVGSLRSLDVITYLGFLTPACRPHDRSSLTRPCIIIMINIRMNQMNQDKNIIIIFNKT